MRNEMTALEPEIAHVDGVSTLNVAFLAMHLLARQHDDEASAWRKFVTVANLTQILHGIGQDMGRLANTIKIVNGASAKAEGMLGKLMGGAAYTHAGSVVNVAVDIINLIDAIEELKQMPASPQKDFATTRVVLASTQLAVDSTLYRQFLSCYRQRHGYRGTAQCAFRRRDDRCQRPGYGSRF